jgi:hypothetical protein
MRFRQKSLLGMRDQLSRLGLSTCNVCGTGNLGVSDYPVIVSFGGVHHEKPDPRHDPEANIWYAVKVECDLCGHMMFFNSERYHTGNEQVLFLGSRELEAQVDPPDEEA